MPVYCKCPAAEATQPPLPGLVEVHLTLGPDAVVIHCEPSVAERLFDARDVTKYVQGTVPVKYQYDSQMVVMLHRIKEAWPVPQRATYANLVAILNNAGFLSPYGKEWTRHNLRQKIEQLGFDIGLIANPEGRRGEVVLWQVDTAEAERAATRAVASLGVRPFEGVELPSSIANGDGAEDDEDDEEPVMEAPKVWDAEAAESEMDELLGVSNG